jgi:hypothetical protein
VAKSFGQESLHSHSKIGQESNLSVPEHNNLQQAGHVGVGSGLQMVDLQPHSSSTSTNISHFRQLATLIAGHNFGTHSLKAGQQHSVPATNPPVFKTSHLPQLTSGIFGQDNWFSFSEQQLHGKISYLGQHSHFLESAGMVFKNSPSFNIGGFSH